ncbi:MAG: hypothetical protein COA78_10965 [Blastopirellula sp.]|nr:MAG: hypothetical protein COA78_10965 [Blastopirellula sp.]
MTKRYCIKSLYRPRKTYTHFDDSQWEDEWQLEIYLHALGLMIKHDLKTVIDIGTGSGYKLVTYLKDYDITGLELSVNVELLKKKYPNHKWLESDFSDRNDLSADVVICSDVVEHLVDPDELLDFIKSIQSKYIIISTPDRGLTYGNIFQKGFWGPPRNEAHIREWNRKEFNSYISEHFNIIDHRVPNFGQRTQMIICENKK